MAPKGRNWRFRTWRFPHHLFRFPAVKLGNCWMFWCCLMFTDITLNKNALPKTNPKMHLKIRPSSKKELNLPTHNFQVRAVKETLRNPLPRFSSRAPRASDKQIPSSQETMATFRRKCSAPGGWRSYTHSTGQTWHINDKHGHNFD